MYDMYVGFCELNLIEKGGFLHNASRNTPSHAQAHAMDNRLDTLSSHARASYLCVCVVGRWG